MSQNIQVEQHTSPEPFMYNGFNHGPFSSPQWLEAFTNDYLKPVYFVFREKENTIGSIMGLEVGSRKKTLRKMGFYKNLEFYTGPELNKPSEYVSCIRSLEEKARKLGYFRINYNSWDHHAEISVNPYKLPRPNRNEYVLELEQGPNYFIKKINKTKIRNIRQARKLGLELVEDTRKENLDLQSKMMRYTKSVRDQKGYSKYYDNIFPHLNKQVMENLIDNKIMRIFKVVQDEKILCIVQTLSYGKRVVGLLLGNSEEAYKTNANALLLHDLGCKFRDEGKIYLNLGSVTLDKSGDNLRRFKMSLGATEYPIVSGKSDFLQNRIYLHIQKIFNKVNN
jgi:hypothetical protein